VGFCFLGRMMSTALVASSAIHSVQAGPKDPLLSCYWPANPGMSARD